MIKPVGALCMEVARNCLMLCMIRKPSVTVKGCLPCLCGLCASCERAWTHEAGHAGHQTSSVSPPSDKFADASHCLWQDIEFIDIIEYDPQQMAAPPYRLRISTKLPSAGDRVRPPKT